MAIISSFIFLQLLLLITLVVHESAHGIVMRWFKIPIKEVFLGFPSLITIRTMQFPIKIGPLMLLGGVVPDKDIDTFHWAKRFLAVLAGPVVSIFFGILLYRIAEAVAPGVDLKGVIATTPIQDPCQSSSFFLMIMKETGRIYRAAGISAVIAYFGLFNIAVGLINLLPIPPLDGGRLILLGLEGIFGPRVRKIAEVLYLIGGLLMICYMLYFIVTEIWAFGTHIPGSPIHKPC